MSVKMNTEFLLLFRNVLFLSFMLNLIVPICAIKLSNATENYNLGPWVFCFLMFVLMPVVDHILGKDKTNLTVDPMKDRTRGDYYSFLILLSVLAVIAFSVYCAYFFSATQGFNWIGRIGWLVSLGMCIAGLALCPGHELIHRQWRIERLIGGFLLAFICNGFLATEHIRGHHVNVATPADIGTARFNQSFYAFFLQALRKSFVNAWLLEKKRLNRMGTSVLSWRNRLICWYFVSIGMAIAFYLMFGSLGLIFFLSQGLISLVAHQVINYIQHYGLSRCKKNDGRYERFSFEHAWNSNCLLSGMLSFQLQRHSDHHLNPRRPYQLLQHIDESPQMPTGYFGMFMMALIPPLWFKVLNPIVLANQRGKTSKLMASNLRKISSAEF